MLIIFFSSFFPFQGGEVVQETITSNVGEDIITLEFQRTDGTLITLLLDFRNVSLIEFSVAVMFGQFDLNWFSI